LGRGVRDWSGLDDGHRWYQVSTVLEVNGDQVGIEISKQNVVEQVRVALLRLDAISEVVIGGIVIVSIAAIAWLQLRGRSGRLEACLCGALRRSVIDHDDSRRGSRCIRSGFRWL